MYRIWLKEVEGNDASAYCTLCKVEFDLGCMRKSALDSHGRGAKHKRLFLEVNDEPKNLPSVANYFQKSAAPKTNAQNTNNTDNSTYNSTNNTDNRTNNTDND